MPDWPAEGPGSLKSFQQVASPDRSARPIHSDTHRSHWLRLGVIVLFLLPILAACGFGSNNSNDGQISWTQGTRSPDGIAPPVSTETAQPTVATTVIAEPSQPATTPLPTMPATTAAPTVAATTAATSAPAEPTKPAVTGQVLSPEQLQDYQPNELGYVPVIMYHNIVQEYTGEEEGDVLFRTEAELRADLQWLYDNNFYVVTLREYIENRITAPAGKHPVVLTFDDSRPNQFYYDIAADGSVTTDPHSVVGILEDFFSTHPDFGHTALFAILPIWCFDFEEPEQEPYCQQKLEWLVANGYEVANHTWDHQDMSNVSTDVFLQKVGDTIEFIQQNSGQMSSAEALILPYGNFPDTDVNPDAQQEWEWIRNGFDYNGQHYQLWTVVAAGAEPGPSPNSSAFDEMSIARIGGKDEPGPGEGNLFLDYWFGQFESRPDLLYTSDGNPDTVTVPEVLPAEQEGLLDTDKIESVGKQLIQY
jgi:peptidoglycan/xylan/chitin deacetylase (PgdA/CDA1 family)